MIQFDKTRFLSVARWDMVINRKFYLNQAVGLLVLATFPVVLRFLFWWASGEVSLFGLNSSLAQGDVSLAGHAAGLARFYGIVMSILPIVGLGYMFHNLARKQGRVAELTLPASNVERFLWHALFSLLAPQLVFACSVICADALNLLLSLVFGCVSGVHSLTTAWVAYEWSDCGLLSQICDHPILAYVAILLATLCYMSTFALGNAWKYRYNIIYTCLAHLFLWMGLGIVLMFLAGIIMQFVGHEFILTSLDWNVNSTVALVLLCLLLLALLAGIWALTYRLYCHAQITTRRNR